MEKKNIVALVVVLAVVVLAVFSLFTSEKSVTGEIVNEGTSFPDTESPWCSDTDGGVFSSIMGVAVSNLGKKVADSCTGIMKRFPTKGGDTVLAYTIIIEHYCDKVERKQEMDSSNLGPGYCVKDRTEYRGIEIESGRWVSLEPVCLEVEEREFIDETGTSYNNECDGINYIWYSCNEDKTAVVEEVTVCPEDCSRPKGGCVKY